MICHESAAYRLLGLLKANCFIKLSLLNVFVWFMLQVEDLSPVMEAGFLNCQDEHFVSFPSPLYDQVRVSLNRSNNM